MSTQSYETLVQDIVMYAPHCPEFTATHTLRLAVIDFCNETHWWKYECDPFTLVPNEQSYQLDVPNGTDVVTVVAAYYDNTPLAPIAFSPEKRWVTQDLDSRQGPPSFYNHETPSEIRFLPAPDSRATEPVKVIAALRPKRDSNFADKALMESYAEVLISGALARIYALPNQPFTNGEMASMRYKMFRDGIVKGKIDANKALTTASLRVKPRQP